MKRWLLASVAILSLSDTTRADTTIPDDRLVQYYLSDQFVRAYTLQSNSQDINTVDGYSYFEGVYFPYSQLTQALGLSLTKQGERYFFQHDQTRYAIDAKQHTAYTGEARTLIPQVHIIDTSDELYIHEAFLREWFPIDLMINIKDQRITLPVQPTEPAVLTEKEQAKPRNAPPLKQVRRERHIQKQEQSKHASQPPPVQKAVQPIAVLPPVGKPDVEKAPVKSPPPHLTKATPKRKPVYRTLVAPSKKQITSHPKGTEASLRLAKQPTASNLQRSLTMVQFDYNTPVAMMMTLYNEYRVYLPLKTLISKFKMQVHQESKHVFLFYPEDTQRAFRLDTKRFNLVRRDTITPFDKAEVIHQHGEVYVSTDLLNRWMPGQVSVADNYYIKLSGF